MLAISGAVAVLLLLGLVAWGVSGGPSEPGDSTAVAASEGEATTDDGGDAEVDDDAGDDAGEADDDGAGDGAGDATDKYQEAPACNAFSKEMLTKIGGEQPRKGDGSPTAPPNYGEGELTTCAWTGGEQWVVVSVRFFEPSDDGAGTEAAKREMDRQNVKEEVSGIGEEALFTVEGPCKLLVRDNNVILGVGIQTQSCDTAFAKEIAEDYANENF